MTADKLKERLKVLPFGSEEYIKTLANIFYTEKRMDVKISAASTISLGLASVYGEAACKMYDKMLDKAEEMLYDSNEPSLYLIGAIIAIMEGEKQVNELIYANE